MENCTKPNSGFNTDGSFTLCPECVAALRGVMLWSGGSNPLRAMTLQNRVEILRQAIYEHQGVEFEQYT